MAKEKVLVTGAAGYIGRHVVNELKQMDCDIIVVDYAFQFPQEGVTVSNVSIFSEQGDLYSKLGSPDRCIHLAWRDGFKHDSDAHMADLSKHYTFTARMMRSGIKSMTIMGSMHEIGYWDGMITADTPANPLSMYGIAKNALRQSAVLLADETGVSLKWLRGFYLTGDDLHNHSIFTKLVERAEAGDKTFPFNSGKNRYDFLDIHTLAKQIACAAMQNEVDGIINCCSGKAIPLAEQVESFISEHGFDIKLDYGAFPDRSYDSPCIWGDTSKIDMIMSKC